MSIFYDFHVHSCLSPCGDNDMTPGNIAGMAAVKGLDAIALTDHNTCDNCEAFLYQAEKLGICGICGAEVTTAEEIHVVCLFEQESDAKAFSDELKEHRMKIKNNEKIFGEQLILDKDDNELSRDEFFLPAATDLTLEDTVILGKKHNAFIFPAHVDKTSNGILAILGDMPENPSFCLAEYHDKEKCGTLKAMYPTLSHMGVLTNSDAHFLWDINDAVNSLDVQKGTTIQETRQNIFKYLRGIGEKDN